MVNQKPIQVHDTTHNFFRIVKVKFCAKIEKQISDNEFILKLLESFIEREKIKID